MPNFSLSNQRPQTDYNPFPCSFICHSVNPFMSLNLSGLCATTKLIQCQMYGVDSVEVSRKFEKNPSEVSDLSKADFLARKKVLREVEKWCESMQSKPKVIPDNTWRLINYHYEVCN